jgi:hypothetical protein
VFQERDVKDFRPGLLTEGASFGIGAFEWIVDYRRITASSRRPKDNCGTKVAAVIRLLHHTPVEAVGHNFHFMCQWAEWRGKRLPQLGDQGVEAFRHASQVSWAANIRRDDALIETTLVAIPGEVVIVRFNHEHRTDPQKNSEAEVAAEKYGIDFRLSVELLQQIYDSEMSNE